MGTIFKSDAGWVNWKEKLERRDPSIPLSASPTVGFVRRDGLSEIRFISPEGGSGT